MSEEHQHHHVQAEDMGGMSDAFLTHAYTPANVGFLPQPDGEASPPGPCGDRIELHLRVRDGVIADARYMPEGCMHTVACGSAMTCLARGLAVKDAMALSAGDISDELGGLDPHHVHCAELAVATLRAALRDYLRRQGQPWKPAPGKG